jgi:hypothetical protein
MAAPLWCDGVETDQVFDMNCQEFWNTMPELAQPAEDADCEHVRECAACAALLNRQRTLALGLRRLAADWRPVEAPARVENRLRAAFPGQAGLAVPGLPAGWWVPVATWATAAAVVVALAMFLARGRPVAPAHRTASSRVQLAVAEPPADLEMLGDFSDAESDFIPIPNAARIEPNEDLNLVRVEVPRSAMIALGYAVSEDRASEPVEAEVVLGADGLARAVRFLE